MNVMELADYDLEDDDISLMLLAMEDENRSVMELADDDIEDDDIKTMTEVSRWRRIVYYHDSDGQKDEPNLIIMKEILNFADYS